VVLQAFKKPNLRERWKAERYIAKRSRLEIKVKRDRKSVGNVRKND